MQERKRRGQEMEKQRKVKQRKEERGKMKEEREKEKERRKERHACIPLLHAPAQTDHHRARRPIISA
jgi:hypothetical protein